MTNSSGGSRERVPAHKTALLLTLALAIALSVIGTAIWLRIASGSDVSGRVEVDPQGTRELLESNSESGPLRSSEASRQTPSAPAPTSLVSVLNLSTLQPVPNARLVFSTRDKGQPLEPRNEIANQMGTLRLP